MIKVYAYLVYRGIKTLEDVPEKIRLAVDNAVEELKQTFDNQ